MNKANNTSDHDQKLLQAAAERKAAERVRWAADAAATVCGLLRLMTPEEAAATITSYLAKRVARGDKVTIDLVRHCCFNIATGRG